MANIDVDFGMQPGRRPRAIVEAYRNAHREEQPAAPRNAPRPKFSRITLGQLVRTLILVVLCLGIVQLSHAERADDDAGVAAPEKRM
ncbi:hypothetical protein ACNHKD_11165 [Methylocystis sp. JAN1]|uniref:hypothetical protein n=1 Tax=Methylocystis sp. JAN1 TaxID=3397211 RepID=UPI003FA204C5